MARSKLESTRKAVQLSMYFLICHIIPLRQSNEKRTSNPVSVSQKKRKAKYSFSFVLLNSRNRWMELERWRSG